MCLLLFVFYAAETSITVDDVTHVIDSGFVKEQRFHPVSGLSVLEEVYIAQSNATQRSGRAGRVRPGHSWRLYSQHCMQSLSGWYPSCTHLCTVHMGHITTIHIPWSAFCLCAYVLSEFFNLL